jgi:hypothetical protein
MMFGFLRHRRKPMETVSAGTLRFLGEQDGPVERTLKDSLIELFERDGTVANAYLARVAYGTQPDISVALCIRRPAGNDGVLAQNVGKVFGPIFAKDVHLDIIFVDSAQELELIKVCPSFFRSRT